jgi:hypothetical protein
VDLDVSVRRVAGCDEGEILAAWWHGATRDDPQSLKRQVGFAGGGVPQLRQEARSSFRDLQRA